ncbi:YadA C-terminal domain-containing protein [Proteus terrae]|uniref:YadA C-terminal domain-containing protein n=1 Tax=Proteus terrae TaxID=1574161 RepID=UPI00301E61B9
MKLKNTTLFCLSLIYSINAFSVSETTTDKNIILLENSHLANNHPNNTDSNSTYLNSHPMKNDITRPIFDEFVSDIYIYHDVEASSKKHIEVIKITDEIIKMMNEEIKKNVSQENTNINIEKVLITDNQRGNNSLKLDSMSPDFKTAILNYLSNFSEQKENIYSGLKETNSFNKNKIDDIIKKPIEIQRHYQPSSKLSELNANIERGMKVPPHSKEIIFKLEESIVEKFANVEKKRTEDNRERQKTDNELNEKIHHTIAKLDQHANEINDNKNRIETKNNTIQSNIENNKTQIDTNKSNISINKNNIATNKNDIITNKTDIDINKDNITSNRNKINTNSSDIKANKENIETNKEGIDNIKEKYIDNLNINGSNLSLKNHFSTLYIEQSVARNEFKDLKTNFEYFKSDTQNRFYKVEKRANQGIASVAAMSNLPFTDSATFSTAIGIGNYRNATALAWGMQYRINENIKVRASTAWNESNWVSAGGVGISW